MIDEQWLLWLCIASVAVFVVSLATLPWLVARIPADYFCHRRREPAEWKSRRPLLRLGFLVLKNLLGLVLLLGGIIMLFIPGQGLLTMMVGMVLMDYPGKYALERRIASIPSVHSALNWLRSKRGAPPLQLDSG